MCAPFDSGKHVRQKQTRLCKL